MVGRYPANDLIPRRPVPRRRNFGPHRMPDSDVAGDYPQFPAAIPNHGVGYRRLTHPSATGPIRSRPVRLACLIHAANVHSEPGSNPSKMSRSPAMPPLATAHSSGSRSPPERVEEICWSHRHSTIAIGPATSAGSPRGPPVSCHPPPPHREGRVPVLASHPDALIPVDPPGRVSSRRSHAGFPQGFLTRRILTFVSLCLADECHRPNCQRIRSDPLDDPARGRVRWNRIAEHRPVHHSTRRHRPV